MYYFKNLRSIFIKNRPKEKVSKQIQTPLNSLLKKPFQLEKVSQKKKKTVKTSAKVPAPNYSTQVGGEGGREGVTRRHTDTVGAIDDKAEISFVDVGVDCFK